MKYSIRIESSTDTHTLKTNQNEKQNFKAVMDVETF